jgi:hypothetical protein
LLLGELRGKIVAIAEDSIRSSSLVPVLADTPLIIFTANLFQTRARGEDTKFLTFLDRDENKNFLRGVVLTYLFLQEEDN